MKTISEGAVKLLKEYADRSTHAIDPDPVASYTYGVKDGMTLLAEQLLEQIKESE